MVHVGHPPVQLRKSLSLPGAKSDNVRYVGKGMQLQNIPNLGVEVHRELRREDTCIDRRWQFAKRPDGCWVVAGKVPL